MAKQLTVTIYVAPAAAVRAGKAHCGEIALLLSDADVAQLSDDQRDTLARHLAQESYWRAPLSQEAPEVAEASLTTLRQLLDVRREVVRAKEAEAAARLAQDDAAYARTLAYARKCPLRELLDPDRGYVLMCGLHKVDRDGARAGFTGAESRWIEDAATAAGRAAEAKEELLRQKAEAQARRDRQKAEAEQREREIAAEVRHRIEQQRPELLPVYDAGLARDVDVRAALYAAVCAELRTHGHGLECVSVRIGDAESGLRPDAYAIYQRVEQAVAALPWETTLAVHAAAATARPTDYADEGEEEPTGLLVAVVTVTIGKWEILAAVLLEGQPRMERPIDLLGE
jgi:hypothetical protein